MDLTTEQVDIYEDGVAVQPGDYIEYRVDFWCYIVPSSPYVGKIVGQEVRRDTGEVIRFGSRKADHE